MAGEQHVLATKLRPVVELYTVAVACLAAAVSSTAPWAVALTPVVGNGIAVFFLFFALVRGVDAYSVVRYQRNLKRLAHFEMTSKEIPVHPNYLWMGKGFRWTREHAQLLADCDDPAVAKYVEPSRVYQFARSLERRFDGSKSCGWISRLLAIDSVVNPVRPLPDVGGTPLLHGVEPKEVDLYLPLYERVGHVMVVGTTRVGKTRACEIYVTQDIHRIGREGKETVIVVDPKGDGDLLCRMQWEAERAGRAADFRIIHLAYPECSARFNPIGRFGRTTEVPSRIASQLSGFGDSAAFQAFAWRFTNIIARALVSLGVRPDYIALEHYVQNIDNLLVEYAEYYFKTEKRDAWVAIIGIAASITDKEIPMNMRGRDRMVVAIDRYIASHKIYDVVMEGLLSAARYDRTYFDKIVASLLPFFAKVTSCKVSEILSPDYLNVKDTRPILDWEQIVKQRLIVYMGLDCLTDAMVGGAVGNSFIADGVSYFGTIYNYGSEPDPIRRSSVTPAKRYAPISIHLDEFSEIAGDEFIPMVNKAGGAGVRVTAYTQTLSDIEAKLGNKAKAYQLLGNFNTVQVMRIRDPATAKFICDQFPKVRIYQRTQVSGATDAADPNAPTDFTSSNQDRISQVEVPLFGAAYLMKLPKGQMISFQQGGELFKARLPLPKMEKGAKIPAAIQEVGRKMNLQHEKAEPDWWTNAVLSATALERIKDHLHEGLPSLREATLTSPKEEPVSAAPREDHDEQNEEGVSLFNDEANAEEDIAADSEADTVS